MSLLNRELEYFLAICETRNLARAAAALGISQPALTRSLQRLESHVGAQLFDRAPRGVELTPIGVALRARADRARITLDDAEREVAQLAAGKIGKVRIGAGHMVARFVSQSLLPRFIVERPTAQVQFHVAFNAELFGLIESGNLDFAVCGLLETPPKSALSGTPCDRSRRDRARRSPAHETRSARRFATSARFAARPRAPACRRGSNSNKF